MGVVYEVFDREREAQLALKMLPVVEADALYRFKEEFRSLADLSHPNIINLYELFSAGRNWFFTMELVDGRNFLTYVRNAEIQENPNTPTTTVRLDESTHLLEAESWPEVALETLDPPVLPDSPSGGVRCDPQRLRSGLRQIVHGLNAIHQAGKLHCDLKPSNVLVTREGRVVILDFGLVADLKTRSASDRTRLIAGTIAYMSPEQSLRLPLTPASDWFSLGVILFEALTGSVPFNNGHPSRALSERAQYRAYPPSRFCSGIPEDLDRLCVDLLDSDPAKRPSGEQILLRLTPAAEPQVTKRVDAFHPSIFVGRKTQIQIMHSALTATESNIPVVAHIRGSSGIGKSSLLEQFLRTLTRRDDIAVLAGRCYELERVPYNGLDGVVDSLMRYLRRLPSDHVAEILPRDIATLAELFPVLRRVPAIDLAPRRRSDNTSQLELRQRGFAAFRELLARLGDRKRLVVAIDDLHWGDFDSGDLLAELLRSPDAPVMLLIVCYRTEHEERSACLQRLFSQNTSYARFDVNIGPLTVPEVREMTEQMAVPLRGTPLEDAAALLKESGGNPYFIHELIRDGEPPTGPTEVATLDSLIWRRANTLPQDQQTLLQILAVSGKPIRLSLALKAAGLDTSQISVFNEMRNARIVRTATATDLTEIETYHDRIRETVLAHLPADVIQDRSLSLANSLEASGFGDSEHLAVLFDQADYQIKAASYYAMAAAQSFGAFAFRHSVNLYQRALQLTDATGSELRELQRAYAESLANAGISREAAIQFEKAAEGADSGTAIDLKRRAAYYYCTSGSVDEGKAVFREILRHCHLRLPETPRQAFFSFGVAQVRLRIRGLEFHEKNADRISFNDIERIDSAWAAALGLSVVDIITGCSFTTRGLLLALRSGDPKRIARSLCWEAATASIMNSRRAAQLIEPASKLVERLQEPYLTGLFKMTQAILAMNDSQWKESLRLFDEAVAIWSERCRDVEWELATARTFSLWCLNYLGLFREEASRTRLRRREAEERGNLYMLTNIGAYPEPHVLLAKNAPDEAEAILNESLRKWTPQGYHVQHANAAASRVNCYLYRGDAASAFKHASEHCDVMHKNGFMRVNMNRVLMLMLHMNSAIAMASRGQNLSSSMTAAEEDAKRLEHEDLSSARAFGCAGRAAVAGFRGQEAEARRLLTKAINLFESQDMGAHTAVLRRHLGRQIGGDAGTAMVSGAEAWLRNEQVADIPKFSLMLFPWQSSALNHRS